MSRLPPEQKKAMLDALSHLYNLIQNDEEVTTLVATRLPDNDLLMIGCGLVAEMQVLYDIMGDKLVVAREQQLIAQDAAGRLN